MPREKLVRPKGLITQPNEHGRYAPGSMSTCINLIMRRMGVLEAMRTFQKYGNGAWSLSHVAKMFPGDASALVVSHTANRATHLVARVDGATDDPVYWKPFGASVPWEMLAGKVHRARARGRDILSTEEGCAVIDSESTADARLVGLPAPSSIHVQSVSSTDAQAVPASYWRSWRAVFVRVHSDGYEQIGPVSHGAILDNSSTVHDVTLRVGLEPASNHTLVAGDYVELYATKGVSNAHPGDRHYRVRRQQLVAGDFTNGYVDVLDDVVADALGEELYTNAGIYGIKKSYAAPRGRCVDVVQYKKQTFYAIPDELSSYRTRIKGEWGSLGTAALRRTGIGRRFLTGDLAVGNPTITNVSAADMVGVAVGQAYFGSGSYFNGTARVASMTATTITMDENALATQLGATVGLDDVIEVNGTELRAPDGDGLATQNISQGLRMELQMSDFTVVAPTGLSTTLMAGPSITFRAPNNQLSISTIRASNGDNYEPPLPDMDETALAVPAPETRLNRVYYSEPGLPEAAPDTNFLDIGDGEYLKGWATEDALWFWCTDGLYRATGEGDEWYVHAFDTDLRLRGRDGIDSMLDTMYAHTNRGMVSVSTAGGVQDVTEPLIGDLLREVFADEFTDAGEDVDETSRIHVACDPERREVWFGYGYWDNAPTPAKKHWVFNAKTGAITEWDDDNAGNVHCLAYLPYLRVMSAGRTDSDTYTQYLDNDENYVDQVTATFQPFDGGDPFVLKEWIDIEWLISISDDLTDAVSQGALGALYAGTITSRSGQFIHTSHVKRAKATEHYIEPHLTATINQVGPPAIASNFKLYGLAPRFEHVAPQVSR